MIAQKPGNNIEFQLACEVGDWELSCVNELLICRISCYLQVGSVRIELNCRTLS